MGISEQIEHDVAEAMKAKDELRLSTLRLIRAAIKNQLIEMRSKSTEVVTPDAMDQLAITVLKRHVKQTNEAIEDFKRGERADLVSRAEQELGILQSYLPTELSDEAISLLIQESLAAAGPSPHMGKLIGDVMKRVAGRADGARVRTLVEQSTKHG